MLLPPKARISFLRPVQTYALPSDTCPNRQSPRLQSQSGTQAQDLPAQFLSHRPRQTFVLAFFQGHAGSPARIPRLGHQAGSRQPGLDQSRVGRAEDGSVLPGQPRRQQRVRLGHGTQRAALDPIGTAIGEFRASPSHARTCLPISVTGGDIQIPAVFGVEFAGTQVLPAESKTRHPSAPSSTRPETRQIKVGQTKRVCEAGSREPAAPGIRQGRVRLLGASFRTPRHWNPAHADLGSVGHCGLESGIRGNSDHQKDGEP